MTSAVSTCEAKNANRKAHGAVLPPHRRTALDLELDVDKVQTKLKAIAAFLSCIRSSTEAGDELKAIAGIGVVLEETAAELGAIVDAVYASECGDAAEQKQMPMAKRGAAL